MGIKNKSSLYTYEHVQKVSSDHAYQLRRWHERVCLHGDVSGAEKAI
jgi:hypothetical protein